MRALPRALGALSIVCLLTAPLAATTYQRVADADLVDQAPVIIEAVTGASTNRADGRLPATDYRITVERAIRGAAAGDTLTVRVPGGRRADGMSLQIWGAPRFQPGERVLLFLAPDAGGSFHVLHLMLGAFHVRTAADGRTLAVRDLSEAKEVSGGGRRPGARSLPFPRLARRPRRRGAPRAGLPRARGAGPAGSFLTRYTLLQAGGARMRWFGFEEGGSVAWAANSAGQPGGRRGRLRRVPARPRGLERRAHDPHPLRLRRPDRRHRRPRRLRRRQRDPLRRAGRRSVRLRQGGRAGGRRPLVRRPAAGRLGGESFIPVTGADIVTNAGIGCFLARSANPSKAAEEIFGHELGHTLGLSHSCGDAGSGACAPNGPAGDALMRAYLHDDGRGARLADDDRRALQALYRPGIGSSTAPLAPPTSLIVQGAGLTASLLWEDRSGGEEGFRVYRATGTGKLVRIAELPAGTTVYVDPGLKPGSRYEYQVAAFNARGKSRGPRAAIATPALQPLAGALAGAAAGGRQRPPHRRAGRLRRLLLRPGAAGEMGVPRRVGAERRSVRGGVLLRLPHLHHPGGRGGQGPPAGRSRPGLRADDPDPRRRAGARRRRAARRSSPTSSRRRSAARSCAATSGWPTTATPPPWYGPPSGRAPPARRSPGT